MTGILIDQMHHLVMEYSDLDNFCFAEVSSNCAINNKPDNLSKFQPDKFWDKLFEENH